MSAGTSSSATSIRWSRRTASVVTSTVERSGVVVIGVMACLVIVLYAALVERIAPRVGATDATFSAIAARLTPAALVELQLSVGFYIMTSKFLETFDIDMQPVEQVV